MVFNCKTLNKNGFMKIDSGDIRGDNSKKNMAPQWSLAPRRRRLCVATGITPIVTMFHWDLPAELDWLDEDGVVKGW